MKLKGRLVCLDKQEYRDEIYIKVDKVKVASRKNMKEGRSLAVECYVEGRFLIEVFEDDSSNDDLIGYHLLDADELVGTGERTVTFDGRFARYKLYFYVYPDDSTC